MDAVVDTLGYSTRNSKAVMDAAVYMLSYSTRRHQDWFDNNE